jgi:hypothetical protein
VGIGNGGGEEKTIKMHKKGDHFVKQILFFMLSGISRFLYFWVVISGNINPLGGLPGTNPGFLETQMSTKNRVWKRFG